MNLIIIYLIFILHNVLSEEIQLPTELNTEEFDKISSSKLLFVEFYSPYCHHCKEFFPTWKKTYQQFKSNYPDIDIEMRQVNCVENGDLCDRENIAFYPNLQLYAPKIDKEGKVIGSSNVDSFPRNLERNPDNIIKYLKSSYSEFDKSGIMQSSSKLIDKNEIMNVIAGEIDIPHFITFFPTIQSQFDNDKYRYVNCLDCVIGKQTWDRLSNKILSIIQTGHFMCTENPTICEKLEIDVKHKPAFIMFLPKSVGFIRIDYTDQINLEKMKNWATKLYENTRYEVVSARGITEIMEYTKTLPHEPIPQNYPLKSKITIIYYYDVDAISKEDEDILPYIVKILQKSPFNIQLVKAKHAKIEQNLDIMSQELIKYINYDPNNQYEFDKNLDVALKITSKPTLLVFKDNSLIADVYQSYAPEDIRSPDKIESFINGQFPLYGELLNELIPYYFNGERKIVVIFIDTTDLKKSDEELFKLSLSAHEYYYLQKKHNFNDIQKLREKKQEKVNKLKETGAEDSKIIQASRKYVPHHWNANEVLFTFIDKSNTKIKRINPDDYEVGDAIVLDNTYLWKTNLEGSKLKNDPRELRDLLKAFLDRKPGITFHLQNSPYFGILRFMDFIHQYGFFGYLVTIITIYILTSVLLKLRRKRRRRTDGIINSFIPKKD
ncbi:unnamed protein product [Candida verbasci]|uniref:Thioredoxin domain-containing protein n=1 Tax=Candida verbasci TaxID=1227364 RepID=A0A9W4XHI3_9ASCO|nr:unnamed protein product [Candida verbasci]